MANYQKKVYYVTQEIYNILWNDGAKDGSYTHNGVTYTYDEDATYYVQDRGGNSGEVDLSDYSGNVRLSNNNGDVGLLITDQITGLAGKKLQLGASDGSILLSSTTSVAVESQGTVRINTAKSFSVDSYEGNAGISANKNIRLIAEQGAIQLTAPSATLNGSEIATIDYVNEVLGALESMLAEI